MRGGPLVLHVPDTGDRYHVLQFVDAWTNNFAYVGRRATGTAEAEFLLVEPGTAHDAPPGMRTIEIPGGLCIIIGRVQARLVLLAESRQPRRRRRPRKKFTRRRLEGQHGSG